MCDIHTDSCSTKQWASKEAFIKTLMFNTLWKSYQGSDHCHLQSIFMAMMMMMVSVSSKMILPFLLISWMGEHSLKRQLGEYIGPPFLVNIKDPPFPFLVNIKDETHWLIFRSRKNHVIQLLWLQSMKMLYTNVLNTPISCFLLGL